MVRDRQETGRILYLNAIGLIASSTGLSIEEVQQLQQQLDAASHQQVAKIDRQHSTPNAIPKGNHARIHRLSIDRFLDLLLPYGQTDRPGSI
jgi:hypothetical protein